MDDIMMRGMNMQQMMKQAKAMQKKMMAEQEDLAEQEFVGKAPDDMVTATFSGDNQLVDLKIDPQAVDPDDVDMLQDLVIAAIKDGMKQVNDATQQKLGKYTKGMGL
jgi:DNA-binding YbaB/EbfC family protein